MPEMMGLLADEATLGKMTDREFSSYWAALGHVVRIAAGVRAAPEGATRTELSCVSASTERAWSPQKQRPAPAIGFGPEQQES